MFWRQSSGQVTLFLSPSFEWTKTELGYRERKVNTERRETISQVTSKNLHVSVTWLVDLHCIRMAAELLEAENLIQGSFQLAFLKAHPLLLPSNFFFIIFYVIHE